MKKKKLIIGIILFIVLAIALMLLLRNVQENKNEYRAELIKNNSDSDIIVYEFDGGGTGTISADRTTITISGAEKIEHGHMCGGTPPCELDCFWYGANGETVTTIIVEEGVKELTGEIGDCLPNLTTIVLPDSLTILNQCFKYNPKLTTIEWGENLKTISMWTFRNCESLTEINLPNSVESIENQAFMECTNLEKVSIPNSVTNINRISFQGTKWYNNLVRDNEGLLIGENILFDGSQASGEVEIPYGVRVIADGAFSDYTGITDIVIPETVTNIGYTAFSRCSQLTSATILNEEVDIKNNSFPGMDTLTIKGWGGSTAQTYATERGNSFEEIIINAFEWSVDSVVLQVGETEEIALYCIVDEDTKYNITQYCGVYSLDEYAEVEGNIVKGISVGTAQLWSEQSPSEEVFPTMLNVYVINGDKFNIGDTEVTLSEYTYIYDGNEKKPEVTVKYGTETLVENTDYEVRYENNVNVGTAKVRIIGKENYVGEKTVKFTISQHEENDFEYNIIDDNAKKVEIKKYNGNSETLTIPDKTTINGQEYTVTQIGKNAFLQNYDIGYLTIPDTIEIIDQEAFAGCGYLIKVTFSENSNLKSIEGGAFRLCPNLLEINLPNKLETIEEHAFVLCSSLKSINIPASVKYIGPEAFGNTEGLESLTVEKYNQYYSSENNVLYNKNKTELIKAISKNTGDYIIPESVNKIIAGAFHYTHYNSITISKNLTQIDEEAFSTSNGLNSIYVVQDNQNYKSVDGVLYTYDGKILIKAPDLKAVTEVLDETEEIKYSAFWANDLINNIDLKNVKIIGKEAFSNCWGITTITIPPSVEIIKDGAFNNCKKIEEVKILSSEIVIEDYNFLDSEESIKIYCYEDAENVIKYAQNDGLNIEVYKHINNIKLLNNSDNEIGTITISKNSSEDIKVKLYNSDGSDKILDEKLYIENTTGSIDVIKGDSNIYNLSLNKYTQPTQKNIKFITRDGNKQVSLKINIVDDYEINVDKTELTNKDIVLTINARVNTNQYTTMPKFMISKDNEIFEEIGVWPVDGGQITTNIEENGTYTIKVYLGNNVLDEALTKQIRIDNIDKVAAICQVTQETVETGINVKITSNEKIQSINGWNISNDKLSLTKIYTVEGDYTIKVKDLAGNETPVSFTIEGKSEDDKTTFKNGIKEEKENNTTYLTNINPSTTISNFMSNVETQKTKVLVDKEGNQLTDTSKNLTTGMKLQIKEEGQVLETYEIVVKGDLVGNGDIRAGLLRLARYKAGIDLTLQGSYLKAADIDGKNGAADDVDLLKLASILANLDNF